MKAEMVELHKGVEERVKEVKQLKQLREKDYEKAYEKVSHRQTDWGTVFGIQHAGLCADLPLCVCL